MYNKIVGHLAFVRIKFFSSLGRRSEYDLNHANRTSVVSIQFKFKSTTRFRQASDTLAPNYKGSSRNYNDFHS